MLEWEGHALNFEFAGRSKHGLGKMYLFRLGLLLWLVPGFLWGAESLPMPIQSSYSLGKLVRWIEIRPGDLHYNEESPGAWLEAYPKQQGTSDTFNFAYTESRFWFEINISNSSPRERTAVLEAGTTWIDSLTLFSGSEMSEKQESGDMLARDKWAMKYRYPSFRLNLKPGEEKKYWLLVSSQDAMLFPLRLWDEESLVFWDGNRNVLEGLYYGLLVTICIINMAIFIFSLRLAFLAYSLYIAFFILTQLSLDGIIGSFFEFLPPWLINRFYGCFNICAVAFAGIFTNQFLSMKKIAPGFSRFFFKTCLFLLALAAFSLFFTRNTIPVIGSIAIAIGFAPFALVSAVRAFSYDRRSATFFIAAWTPVVLSVFVLGLSFFNLIQVEHYARLAMLIGIAMEVIIFSIGLGDQLARSIREHALAKSNLEAAEAVQKALIPIMPTIYGCSFQGWYQSADSTGGDWYDIIHDAERQLLYCFIGDVTGHGISSTLVSSAVSGTVHGVMEQKIKSHRSLQDTLLEVALSVNRAVQRTGSSSGRLLTLNLIGIDLKSWQGVLVNAGHCHPLIFRQKKVLALASQGSILGFEQNPTLFDREFSLQKGDKLFLYTDGLIHKHSQTKAEIKLNRLVKQLCGLDTARQIVEKAKEIWLQTYASSPREDDCAILVLEVTVNPTGSPGPIP